MDKIKELTDILNTLRSEGKKAFRTGDRMNQSGSNKDLSMPSRFPEFDLNLSQPAQLAG